VSGSDPTPPSANRSAEAQPGPVGVNGSREGEPLLSVRDIAKSYGEREALRGVSFDARAGELVAVIGPNGAGKTTLLSIVAGAQRASAGSVSLASSRIGWGVGWVPQTPALYSRLSVAENLELFARLERSADPQAAVAMMLEQTGLQERASERVERLSGGNRQRVNIAIGLLSDPPALVLDEPSSSLDPRQRERLWRFIGDLAQRGRCVVFSTHNVAEAERYAQQVIVLADGELLFCGSPREFAQAAGSELNPADPGFEGAFVDFLRERGH
jgi:ABC-2 type transport system ATP-binding protein